MLSYLVWGTEDIFDKDWNDLFILALALLTTKVDKYLQQKSREILSNLNNSQPKPEDNLSKVKKMVENNQIKRCANSSQTCAICYDEECKSEMVVLECKHEFHTGCIIDWFTRKVECPMCRYTY